MANNSTPESEFSIECFQNYSAPEVFIQGLGGMVNQTDIETMIRAQKQMLQRFEKTNEMLTNCNALSASRLKVAGAEFKKHTQLLVDMKKDLDYIFKKIRTLKTKLSAQYPEAFEIAQKAALVKGSLEEEEDEFDTSVSSEKKPLTSLNKDISKSTETLKPSISQTFNKTPNETEHKEIAQSEDQSHLKVRLENVLENIDRESKGNTQSLQNCNDSSQPVNPMSKVGKKTVNLKKTTDKVDRTSSGSSSSDNYSNNCSVSSGDNTSDTG